MISILPKLDLEFILRHRYKVFPPTLPDSLRLDFATIKRHLVKRKKIFISGNDF